MLFCPKEFEKSCQQCRAFIDHFVRLALSKEHRQKELEKGQDKEKYIFLEALAAQTRNPIELHSRLLHHRRTFGKTMLRSFAARYGEPDG